MGVWKGLYTFDEPETESRWQRTLLSKSPTTKALCGLASGGIGDAARFAEGTLGFQPDARQRELLLCEAKQGILNCTRQWGKSTVAAIKAVHRAHTVAKSLVVVASPTERQSAEFLLKARGFINELGVRVRGDGHNRASLRLPNGSRIVGLPGKEANIRGFSAVNLLIIDEAARVPDELYKALRPMLTVAHGDLWLLSTPWGKQGGSSRPRKTERGTMDSLIEWCGPRPLRFPRELGIRRRCVGSILCAGDGVLAHSGGVVGGGARTTGRCVVPAGVSV
jgi:hypothetical protein